MDYEQKYKEALERAKIWKDKSGMPKDKQGILDDIFPELKENKDEKIRKALICGMYALKEQHKTCFASIPIYNAIAWLEKQREHVEINPTEFDTRLQALIGKFETLPKEELVGSLSFWLNVVQNDGTYKREEKQGEQKHADWSEEDECYMSECIGAIATKDGWSFEEKRKTKHWLKSLRPQNLWKPADGDDLPEIDREVVVLYQPYPCEGNEYAVGFGHRPKEYWDGRNIETDEVTRYYPKRYDKGGWNVPDVKFWLDLELPTQKGE